MTYNILKYIVKIGLFFYYRKIKIDNKSILTAEGPSIIVANHPNTLIDAWLIGSIMPRQPFFMAKATFFKGKFRSKLLRNFGMIPINRKGEGTTEGVSNANSFLACYEILEEGEVLTIFPEGSSFQERRLREIKSGTARIALETLRRNGSEFPLKIIPIGINYLYPEKFRSDIVIKIGIPILVSDFYHAEDNNDSKSAKRLTEKIRMSLELLLFNSDSKEDEELVEEFHSVLGLKYFNNENNSASNNVEQIRDIRDKIIEWNIGAPWKLTEAKALLEEVKFEINNDGIASHFLDRNIRLRMFLRQLIFSSIFLILALPLFVFGCIHNLVQYLLTDFFVSKITKEVEYYAPMAVLLGLILYPTVYVLFLLYIPPLLNLSFLESCIYGFSLPTTGFFAYFFYNYKGHVMLKWRYFNIARHKRTEVRDLQKKKEKLRALFSE